MTRIYANNHLLNIERIKVAGFFREENKQVIIAVLDEPADLEQQRMGIIELIDFIHDGELREGDIINIQDINLNSVQNRVINNRLSIRGQFGGITVNERVPRVEDLDQAIRQNNNDPNKEFFILKGTDLQDGDIS